MEKLQKGAAGLGILLTPRQEEQFRRFFQELVEANRRINLTTVIDWEEVQIRHFLDSLTVSLVLSPRVLSEGKIVDVGAGAGFPGVPLKIVFPDLGLCLVESTAKKGVFLSHLVGVLDLKGVEIHTGRAEELAHCPALRETFDGVLSRAVAKARVLAELTIPFCKLGGVCVMQKQGRIEMELNEAKEALRTLGGSLREIREVAVPGLLRPRLLVVVEKVSSTPAKYPRRPGVPAKRPL